jgi:predicted DNA-binding antitoxin AbrB/MazE fold protein
MELSIDATYEDGVLKPAEPLPLPEHEKVHVTVRPQKSDILSSYGIMGWTGDAETVDRFAMSDEFDLNECP